MSKNKQRNVELRTARVKHVAHVGAPTKATLRSNVSTGRAPCNPESLGPYGEPGIPPFVVRGFYIDLPFSCCDCQKEEVWRATQQKWWYEVAKGYVESRANRCNSCRRIERERKAEARRVHQEGLVKKHALKAKP